MTMTAVRPEGRYGALSIGQEGQISSFIEKPAVMVHGLMAVFSFVNQKYLHLSIMTRRFLRMNRLATLPKREIGGF